MENKGYILAVDQGTTSTRTIIFDRFFLPIAMAQREHKQIYPKQGYVEHDAEEIYANTVDLMREVVAKASIDAKEILGIGITNQRETVVAWDDSGKPMHNAIVWQCRRTSEYCNYLKDGGYENIIYDKTGLMPDAYFSATKIKWLLENSSTVKLASAANKLKIGTMDSYLMYRLSGGKIFATDYTNASRTMLYNIHKLCYDADLCQMFSVDASVLPSVFPSCNNYGNIDKKILGVEIPILGVAGDQQAALFGQGCINEGEVKNTYGTGCFLLMNTGDKAVKSKRGLITTLAASGGKIPHYALEGSVFVGGAVVQWLRDELKLISCSADSETLAKSVADSGGVYVVPAFVGLGAPYWDSHAKGTICGITRGTGAAHIVRASLESIAYQVFDILHAMERDTGVKINSLKADGGASENAFLMQFQADILGVEVACKNMRETTALGAALLAGQLAYGEAYLAYNTDCGLKNTIYKPSISEDEKKLLIEGWITAVGRTRYR